MKRKLSFLMIFIMIFTICINSYTVKADFIFDFFDWSVEALREVGLIYDPSLHPNSLQEVADEINENDPDADVQATNESIGNYITENTTVNNDNSKTYNQKVKNIINYQIETIINDSGYIYVYTTKLEEWLNNIDDGTKYNAIRQFLNKNSNKIIKLESNTNRLYTQDINDSLCFLFQNIYPNFNQAYTCTPYNINVWTQNYWNVYDYSDGIYSRIDNSVQGPIDLKLDSSKPTGGTMSYYSSGISKDISVFIGFRTINDMKRYSVGLKPYYINSSVYNDWSSSSGDYTVTTDNSNITNYGDITSYIDSFNTEYGRYPTDTDIFKWIENYDPTVNPTPDPDNPSGSGSFVNNNNPSITNNPTFNNNPNINITLFPSVSDNGLNGGTVSGNGGNGSIGNIFDWLGNLGNVIANLIKNVGEMIVNALQGVVEAVTTILSGIPNILTPIIEFVFGGLPEEVQALITLGITCIIFVGIIKVLKR